MIDNGEDGNNQVVVRDGRTGYWYTFVDKQGSTVVPEAGENGGTFSMTPGGAHGSKYAANVHGKVAGGSDSFGGGVGMNFVDPKGPYDASHYNGLAFWARIGARLDRQGSTQGARRQHRSSGRRVPGVLQRLRHGSHSDRGLAAFRIPLQEDDATA